MEPLAFIAGLLCIALAGWDVFETVVVPRPTPGGFRIAKFLMRPSWRAWRGLGRRIDDSMARDRFLGLYAPATVIMLLAAWLLLLVVGYGLILYALRGEIGPGALDPGEAFYLAGTSVLTLGSTQFEPTGPLAQLAVLTAAAAGLGVVALVITFLFSLYGSFQRREVLVVRLQARAGAPPSAVALLEGLAAVDMVDRLPELFAEWEAWSAEVLDTHVAYPILNYFRSSHDNLSWISALGAVLDAAGLVLTTIHGIPRGQAEVTKRVGAHLVEDVSNYFGLRGDGSGVDREEFEVAYRRLATSGYELEPIEAAWRSFERARSSYAARLEALAAHWAMPATQWIGKRAPLGSSLHAVPARQEDRA